MSSKNIFGCYNDIESAKIILIPVPWDVSCSYKSGASLGPQSIYKESYQLDLFDCSEKKFFKPNVYMLPISSKIFKLNCTSRKKAKKIIKKYEELIDNNSIDDEKKIISTLNKQEKIKKYYNEINQAFLILNDYVYQETKKYLSLNKKVALVGGDHSTPYGAIKALSEYYPEYGILHIDAHADLRDAYQGFKFSHASIMFNVLNSNFAPKKIVQLGLRDICLSEFNIIQKEKERISSYFSFDLFAYSCQNKWDGFCQQIINELPEKIYISLDVDGLDPVFCPNTGTPVPGGINFNRLIYLFNKLKNSSKQIIGFDLCEVSPKVSYTNINDKAEFFNNKEKKHTKEKFYYNDYNGNVGARILYFLCKSLN